MATTYVRYPATKVIHSLQEDHNFSSVKLQGVQSLLKLFTLLKSFRAPHKKLADEAYEHAGQGEHRDKGSGGYEPGILQNILHQNLTVLEKLKQAMQTYV